MTPTDSGSKKQVKEGIAERFRELLDDRRMSLRRASAFLEDAGLRSAGPTALWKITNAKLDEGPSAEWLAMVARAFGVSAPWLAFGVGGREQLWAAKAQQEHGVADLPTALQHRIVGLAMEAAGRIEGRTLDDQFGFTALFASRLAAVLRLLAGSPLFVPLSDEADSVLGAERIVDGLVYWLRKKIDREEAEGDPVLSALLELAPAPEGGEGAAEEA